LNTYLSIIKINYLISLLSSVVITYPNFLIAFQKVLSLFLVIGCGCFLSGVNFMLHFNIMGQTCFSASNNIGCHVGLSSCLCSSDGISGRRAGDGLVFTGLGVHLLVCSIRLSLVLFVLGLLGLSFLNFQELILCFVSHFLHLLLSSLFVSMQVLFKLSLHHVLLLLSLLLLCLYDLSSFVVQFLKNSKFILNAFLPVLFSFG
jgi:hypothetical protein